MTLPQKIDRKKAANLMDILSYLKEANARHGPSGHEYEVANWLAERFRPLVDSVTIDPLFNVIALKTGLPTPTQMKKGEAPRIMLCAHQDEIALMVAAILPDGMLRMGQVGGVDPRILPASTVTVHGTGEGSQKLDGVVGAAAPHLSAETDRKHNNKREDLFVDLGMRFEKVNQLVNIGDLITLNGETVGLLNGRAAGKTMDDRACIAVMLEAAERLGTMRHEADVYFVCSSQEEVGGIGARTSAHRIDPDLAIVLDVTHADIPQSRPDTCVPLDAPSASCGPFIQHQLLARLKDTAIKHGIKLNGGHSESRTYTDADAIQIAREGVPCVLLELPLKYMHTTVELLDTQVIQECGRLAAHFTQEIREGWDQDLWN